MKHSPYYDRKPVIAFFLIAAFVAIYLIVTMHKADAGMVEAPDHSVDRVEVVYAEPMPSPTRPTRHYFETNDGGAYVYATFCADADRVPDRVCKVVFWYAR